MQERISTGDMRRGNGKPVGAASRFPQLRDRIVHGRAKLSAFSRGVSSSKLPVLALENMNATRLIGCTLLIAALSAAAKLPPEKLKQLPPPAARKVDFAKDIQPIFEACCTQCHARGKDKGGFSIETREKFLKGGDSGVVAVKGRSEESLLIE